MFSKNNCYKDFPDYYDLLYSRYLKSIPAFVGLVGENTSAGGLILDLAAGTGEVSLPLLKNGFGVTSFDLNRGMLNELKKKAGKMNVKNYSLKIGDINKINYVDKFDTVCIRQAVNYFLGLRALQNGFNKIFKSLKTGGKFIFNAPNYDGQTDYPPVHNLYQRDGLNAFVVETNDMKKGMLRHRQYSLVWENGGQPQYITEENSFYMFTKKEFELTLKKAGFSKIDFNEQGKTLYCVATK